MGNFFRMSNHFNMHTPADFGLVKTADETIAVDPIDGSSWHRCSLYDFGWGKENGYFRDPLPDFETLISLVIAAENRDDQYGAAAIIMEKYPDLLLSVCETMAHDPQHKASLKTLNDVFHLVSGFNHSPIIGKTFAQISDDAARWLALSAQIKSVLTQNPHRFWPFG